MAGSQGALIWWFEHPELDKSSISRAPYNFLTTGCPPWVLVIIEPLSQVPQRNVFGPFVLFYVTGDFRLTEQIRQRKNKLFCFYWNCDLLLWELFQFSFFNDKSLWRYPVLWPCSWKKLIERNDMPTYSFIQLKSLFFFYPAFPPLFTAVELTMHWVPIACWALCWVWEIQWWTGQSSYLVEGDRQWKAIYIVVRDMN